MATVSVGARDQTSPTYGRTITRHYCELKTSVPDLYAKVSYLVKTLLWVSKVIHLVQKTYGDMCIFPNKCVSFTTVIFKY